MTIYMASAIIKPSSSLHLISHFQSIFKSYQFYCQILRSISLSLHVYHPIPRHYHLLPVLNNSLTDVHSSVLSMSLISLSCSSNSALIRTQIGSATLLPEVLQRFPIIFRIKFKPFKMVYEACHKLQPIFHYTLPHFAEESLVWKSSRTLALLHGINFLVLSHPLALSLIVTSWEKSLWTPAI